MRTAVIITTLLVVLCSAGPALAQAADKSPYTYWNPTPASLWRPLASDRPRVTRTPYTVDAGAVQLELSFFEWTNDGEDETTRIAPLNLRIGVLEDLDVELGFEPYVDRETPGDDDDGIGDLTLRLRWNVWGNDGDDTALAVSPYLVLPTSGEDLGTEEVAGGVTVPFAARLTEDWTLGLSASIDFVYDGVDDEHDVELLHTAALIHMLLPELAAHGEYIGVVSGAGGSQYEISIGGGLQYLLEDDIAIDFGMVLGLEGGAEDFIFQTGITWRF